MTGQVTVKSTFRYTRDTGVAPEVYFYEPPAGTTWRESGDDPREVTVHNGWESGQVVFARPRGLCAARISHAVYGMG